MIDRFLQFSDRFAHIGAMVAALACFALAAMLIVEVVTTSFFAWSQPWSVEYSTYFLAATLFLGSGWTLRKGGHIRVSALFSLLPTKFVWLVDLLGTGFATGVITFAAYALVEQALRTYSLGSRSYFPSETLLVFPQTMLAIAFVMLALAMVSRLVRLLRREPPQEDDIGLLPMPPE